MRNLRAAKMGKKFQGFDEFKVPEVSNVSGVSKVRLNTGNFLEPPGTVISQML
jgi:hypothetical protein